MTDAAQVEEFTEEAPAVAEVEDTPVEELEFSIFEDTPDEDASISVESAESNEGEEDADSAERTDWSAKVRKDREQRAQEIQLKQREQRIQAQESKIEALENARQQLVDNPSAYFESLGLNPMDVYSSWTNALASGENKPSETLQASANQKEIEELKARLAERDVQAQTVQEQQNIQNYYKSIEDFKGATEKYPLTKERCSSEDIAQGIAAYFQNHGVELGFDEAFGLIEKGLAEQDQKMLNDPALIARFREHHGLDAASKQGKQAKRTLSNNLKAQPTKVALEDMSDEEIMEHWQGKIYT